ncbi:MAG TPA: hypothetical protein DIW17_04065 [Clostridiales bacterium]|nr:hypothetical protein [Clostridiales bacterium]
MYGVGTDVISSITKFVEKNPELVKGVTAFVGVIGLAVGGITAYAAIVKVAIPLTAAFTAAMPGVNVIMGVVAGYAALTAGIVAYAESIKTSEEDLHKLTATSRAEYYQLEDMRKEYERVCTVMGDTSAEAQLLKSKLDDATEAFQKNKQTSEELVASHREIIEAHNELMAVYSETIDGINEEATSNDNLIKKLEDLMLVENKTTETKQELLAVVDLLNEAMPELGLAYDQNADSLNMNAKAIRSVIEAEIEREKNAANYKQLKDLISEESGLYEKLQSQIKETAAAEKELVDAQIAEAAIREELGNVSGEAGGRLYAQKIMPYVLAVNTATEAVSEATEAERQAQDAYNENQSAIHELSSALAEYSNEIETSSGNMQEVISSIRTQMEELAEAYEEAYLAAIESVSGQYELWDKAKEVVSTSAQEINKALESQTEYWQDYNANLGTLTERSADIEGLAEMIASFADGSEGSVNAIAGMANATDEELSAMVSNWQDLQKEQETVASSLAGIEIEFSETMANLQLELETSIAEMDLGNEAAESGKSTIQGFINGAQDMLPELQAAYSRIARAAVAAIDEQLDINSPSRVLELRGEYAMAGFVGGVSSMKPNVEAAMADVASAGTDALTTETISAIPDNSRYGGGVAPTFQFSYDFTGANVGSVPELQSMLESRDANIIDIINDVLDNREIDSSRRAYL